MDVKLFCFSKEKIAPISIFGAVQKTTQLTHGQQSRLTRRVRYRPYQGLEPQQRFFFWRIAFIEKLYRATHAKRVITTHTRDKVH